MFRYVFHLKSGKNIVITDNSKNEDIEKIILELSEGITSPRVCRFQTDNDVLILKADQIEGVLLHTEVALPKPTKTKKTPKVKSTPVKAKKIEIEVSDVIEDDEDFIQQLSNTTDKLLDEELSKFENSYERMRVPVVDDDSIPYDMDHDSGGHEFDDGLGDIAGQNKAFKSVSVTKVGDRTIISKKR